MKRAINFLSVLMLAFVVTFGFVVNTASAATIQCPDPVTLDDHCSIPIRSGDLLAIRYTNNAILGVSITNPDPINTAQIVPTIGSQVQQPLNVQPGGILSTSFPTKGFIAATFKNQSATAKTSVGITITSSL